MWLFDQLVRAHIATGTVGLVCMWIPVIGRKGGVRHKLFGKVFAYSMMLTGFIAIGISICTLNYPLETHAFSKDIQLVRGLFGWMMLYLATMTIMLAWYGLLCIRNKRQHIENRTPLNFLLQFLTFIAAVNCAWHGYVLKQPLMMAIAVVGIAASILNTRFVLTSNPAHNEWLIQHTRGLVGAGISVYTAFLAFGAVNLLPDYAFSPVVWATPTILGVSLLLFHQFRIERQRRRARQKSSARPALTDLGYLENQEPN